MKRSLRRLSRMAVKASLHGGARVPEGHVPICVGEEGALRIPCPIADFNDDKILVNFALVLGQRTIRFVWAYTNGTFNDNGWRIVTTTTTS
jgi:hypothetical protein